MGWDLGPGDFFDVLVVALLCWLAIRYLRRTRARAALLGLAALGAMDLTARWLELEVTASLFRGFFAVVVLVLVVVFQDDLRRFFEQLGAFIENRGRREAAPAEQSDVLVRTVTRLAATRTGALVVVPGREPIERHLEGGIALGGRLSEPLLLSLFDSSSPGHDGAVLLRDGQVDRFAVHLPLSADHAQLGAGGTRHAAALGLAERSDALCIVVSEERGSVSVARDGALRTLPHPEQLGAELAAFQPQQAPARALWRQRATWLEAAAALGLASFLWLFLVPGSTPASRTVPAPVVVENLPPEFELAGVEPESVEVSLSGLRRDFLFGISEPVTVRVDALLVKLGRRTFELEPERVTRPRGVEVDAIEPARVRLSVEPRPAAGAAP